MVILAFHSNGMARCALPHFSNAAWAAGDATHAVLAS